MIRNAILKLYDPVPDGSVRVCADLFVQSISRYLIIPHDEPRLSHSPSREPKAAGVKARRLPSTDPETGTTTETLKKVFSESAERKIS